MMKIFSLLFFICLGIYQARAGAETYLGAEFMRLDEDPVLDYVKRNFPLTPEMLAVMSDDERASLPNIMVVKGDVDGDGDKDLFVSSTAEDNARAGYWWEPYVYDSDAGAYATWMVKYKDDSGKVMYAPDGDKSFNFRPDSFYIGFNKDLGGYGLITIWPGPENVNLLAYTLKIINGKYIGFEKKRLAVLASRMSNDNFERDAKKMNTLFASRGPGTEFYVVKLETFLKKINGVGDK